MEAPLEPCFARAAIENDLGAGQDRRLDIWRKAELKVSAFNVEKTDFCYRVTVEYAPIGEAALVKMVYDVYADGAIAAKEEMTDAGKLADTIMLPRFGMQFAMSGEFSTFEFFGWRQKSRSQQVQQPQEPPRFAQARLRRESPQASVQRQPLRQARKPPR